MSHSKRRKLDSEGPPQSPVSAVSAIAARRRQTASTAQSTSTKSEQAEEIFTPSKNSFSALQALKPNRDATKSPKKIASHNSQRRNDGHPSTAVEGPKPTGQPQDTERLDVTSPLASGSTQIISYSSFRLSKSNCRVRSDGIVELRLDESERFVVLGGFGIRVVDGEITLAGATLRAAETVSWVQAPHCLALPVIRTTQETRLELSNDPNLAGLRKLGRLSPLFRRIWNEEGETADGIASREQSFQIIGSFVDALKRCVIQELVSPPNWNKKLASLLPISSDDRHRTIIVCGPKSSGKSTFSRLLTNRLLTSSSNGQSPVRRVAVLDLDPGQPEYSPPGTLSLVCVSKPNFGAPFTHAAFEDPSNTILRCHSLASVTPASAPSLFISCAVDLYETYQRSLRSCPLIVNTPGWILGTGLDLLVDLITRIRPAEVIYMSEDGPTDVVDVLNSTSKQLLSLLPSQPSEFTSRTAAHFRSMQMMSYFHSHVGVSHKPSTSQRLCWSAHPLLSSRPYEVAYQGNNMGILGILSYDYQSPPELLAASINGSIVAIVEIEESKAFQPLRRGGESASSNSGSVEISSTSEGIPIISNPNDEVLDPRYCKTIGLGLIRGIDSKHKTLQVITPTPLAILEQIRLEGRDLVLLHGNFDTPHWAYTEDLYAKSTQDEAPDKDIQITDEDTSEDEAEEDTVQVERAEHDLASTVVPWIEILKGNQKRPVGSRVWRVRRDLGRHSTD